MSWEKRGRGVYYTRSCRVAGKVRRIYFGKGAVAQLAAALDADKKAQRLARAVAKQAALARLETLAGLTQEFDACVVILAESELRAAGFNRPNRCEWKRSRRYGQSKQPT